MRPFDPGSADYRCRGDRPYGPAPAAVHTVCPTSGSHEQTVAEHAGQSGGVDLLPRLLDVVSHPFEGHRALIGVVEGERGVGIPVPGLPDRTGIDQVTAVAFQ